MRTGFSVDLGINLDLSASTSYLLLSLEDSPNLFGDSVVELLAGSFEASIVTVGSDVAKVGVVCS